VLNKASHVLELGCGISGLIGLVLASKVHTYIATDQEYVFKYLRRNISENLAAIEPSIRSRNSRAKVIANNQPTNNIIVKALDWESDSLSRLYSDLGLTPDNNFISLLISCDCIYNEALVRPFVDTCKDICRMAPSSTPTVCVVAQQLRSSDVFESWLKTFHSYFRVWRLSDEYLSPELAENSGFVVHIGVIRELGGNSDKQ
jgi:Lysine methyltransferase